MANGEGTLKLIKNGWINHLLKKLQGLKKEGFARDPNLFIEYCRIEKGRAPRFYLDANQESINFSNIL